MIRSRTIAAGLTGLFAATVLTSGATVTGETGGTPGTICLGGAFCDAVPACAAQGAPCNYCTAGGVRHEQCLPFVGLSCVTTGPVAGGCGFWKWGACNANNTCISVLTSIPCDRKNCFIKQ